MKYNLLATLLLLAGALTAQHNYIITDTSDVSGVKIYDRGAVKNAQYCERLMDGKIVRYTPYDIREYGFVDGKVYLSKEITLGDSARRVFLEQLVTGPTSLFYYKNEETKFYILENEKIKWVQIPRRSPGQSKATYRDELAIVTADCPDVANAVKLASYRKKMMSLLTERYNDCINKPFPFFKYGLFAGVNFSGLNYVAGVGSNFIQQENKYFKNADFKYDAGFVFGIFIDQPISASNFSVHPEIYFTKNDYSAEYEMDDYYVEVKINTKAINIPVLFRYAFPVLKARPYLNAGVIYAYQFKDEFSTLTMPEDEGEYPAPVVTNQVGLSAGFGYEFDLTYRKRIYIDCRYNYLYGMRVSGQESYWKNEFQFTVGVGI